MAEADKKKLGKNLFKPRNFALLIGLLVFGLVLLVSSETSILERMETNVLDWHFKLKGLQRVETENAGVSSVYKNLDVSPDILIIGIDNKTLDTYGRWPIPRTVHADFLDSISRIKRQNEREAAAFLDIFFVEPDANAFNDVKLIQSIQNNQRVYLETVLKLSPPSHTLPDIFKRHEVLDETCGVITQVSGDTSNLLHFYSAEPPLIPYAENIKGYGHANFVDDPDKVHRRQLMITVLSEEVKTYRLEELAAGFDIAADSREHLAWKDKNGNWNPVELPLTQRSLDALVNHLEADAPPVGEDTDGDNKPDNFYYTLSRFKNTYVPAITLTLAAEYFHVEMEDIKIVVGDHILLENPRVYDSETDSLVPYRIMTSPQLTNSEGEIVSEARYREVPEIKIPINDQGEMLINFMGPRSSTARGMNQTFPVRSYSAYTSRVPPVNPETWPNTKSLGNKILMVGGFFQGTDEKTTPWGLMYGVEIHANALNTIIMDNFLNPIPQWVEILILFSLVMLVSFYTSRMNTGWSLAITLVFLASYFFLGDIVFYEKHNLLLQYATPATAVLISFVLVVIYRVVMEESDKRHLKSMFGKYVNPLVVDQMMDNPPVLGGTDMDITVFFSDIRSFTTLSESMMPQELVTLLNQYLTSMTDCMMDYTGTLDKYIGDAIMGFWGAPLEQKDHARMACKSALKQLELLRKLNETLPEHQRISIGIGLNSGICTVGNMGSQGRMNYTCMGDNVNLASRLEAINKTYRTELVISEYTYAKIQDDPRFICRELDDIRVKGKRKPVRIFELVGYDGSLDPE